MKKRLLNRFSQSKLPGWLVLGALACFPVGCASTDSSSESSNTIAGVPVTVSPPTTLSSTVVATTTVTPTTLPLDKAGTLKPKAAVAPKADVPLSSVVALRLKDAGNTNATNLPDYVKTRVRQYAQGQLPAGVQFPAKNDHTDGVQTITGLDQNTVVKWFDPLTMDESVTAPRFGANADYLAFFGDGWNSDWNGDVVGSAPQFNGDGSKGWLWANHEYISGNNPTPATTISSSKAALAQYLKDNGLISSDITTRNWSQTDLETFVQYHKKHLGGSWVRLAQDANGQWGIDRTAANLRYDSSNDTRLRVTGHKLLTRATVNSALLAEGVVPGIVSNCAGSQSPWGTVISGEENTQFPYGDLEPAWSSSQRFTAGRGFDAGTTIRFSSAIASGSDFSLSRDVNQLHSPEYYGFIAEIDPGVVASKHYNGVDANGDGLGHRKLGHYGRAHWEGASFAVDKNWKLIPGQPVVMYGGDDRRSGRIFKWVSKAPYQAGMTRGQVRALLDDGYLYVSHFAGLDNRNGKKLLSGANPTESVPGNGQWLHLSLDSKDLAPNGAALGTTNKTIGEALKDVNWNKMGGFNSEDDLRRALFTAANKIGAMELNRPEEIEWNPNDLSGKPRLYVTFTNHNRQVALDQNGVLYDPAKQATDAPNRGDDVGAIFAMEEADTALPANSKTFKYFMVWEGTKGSGALDVANPDNLMIDKNGGVWFATDGNYGTNPTADGLFYLDLDPKNQAGQTGVTQASYGKAFRVLSMPSDAEATGPTFAPDMKTVFVSVMHPGEEEKSTWPQDRKLIEVKASALPAAGKAQEVTATFNSLRFIGEQRLAHNAPFKGTTVGGLSGLDYSGANNLYYAISDDRSDFQPARLYTLRLEFDEQRFSKVTLIDTFPIKTPEGGLFPNSINGPTRLPDPEALRYDYRTHTLLWTSEGERIVGTNNILIHPFVREMTVDGTYLGEYDLPWIFKMEANDLGPRRNGVLEGVSLSLDGQQVFAIMEEPLHQDGPRADLAETNSPVRIVRMARSGANVTAQYAYKLEKIAKAASTPAGFKVNGVTEVLAISATKLLVLERSFSDGVGNVIKLFEVDLSQATDVSSFASLNGATYTPVSKKLLLDFDTLKLALLDNVEGLTFGPKLANGKHSLIVVSDNNFSPTQATQFLVFEIN